MTDEHEAIAKAVVDRLLHASAEHGIPPLVVYHFREMELTKQVAEISEAVARIEKAVAELSVRPPGRCWLADAGEAGGPMQLLVTPGGGKAAVDVLEDWLSGAKNLVIVDPYLLFGDIKTSETLDATQTTARHQAYARKIATLFASAKKLQSVEVWGNPGPPNELVKALRKACDKVVRIFRYETEIFHDRVWIRNDGESARVVGTSFGGLGNKYSLLLALPQPDIDALQAELTTLRRTINRKVEVDPEGPRSKSRAKNKKP